MSITGRTNPAPALSPKSISLDAHRSALAEKDRAFVALSKAKDAEIEKIKIEHVDKLAAAARPPEAYQLAALENALGLVTKERDEARAYDVRNSGSFVPAPIAGMLGTTGDEMIPVPGDSASDAEKWATYSQLAARSPRAAKIYKERHLIQA